MALTVVLTSGGLDSAVAAALAAQDGSVALLHCHYGQQAAKPERAAFDALCKHLRPAHAQAVELGNWRALSASTLLAPHGDIEDAPTLTGQLAGTFVPLLAPAMLCAASAWAYSLGAPRVVWGVSLANPCAYPDRDEAIRLLAWQLVGRALPEGAGPVIDAPLAHYDKPAVAELAVQLKVPLDATWSCLRGAEQPCGRCAGCVTRAKALKAVGA